jgi:hypothetical protein
MEQSVCSSVRSENITFRDTYCKCFTTGAGHGQNSLVIQKRVLIADWLIFKDCFGKGNDYFCRVSTQVPTSQLCGSGMICSGIGSGSYPPSYTNPDRSFNYK